MLHLTDEPVVTVFTTRAAAEKYRDIIASGNGVLDDSMYCVDECQVYEKVVEK